MKAYRVSLTRPNKILQHDLFMFLVYLFMPYIFYGIGKELFAVTLGRGDGWLIVPIFRFSGSLSMWNPYLQSGTFAFKDIGSFQALYLPTIIVMRIFPPVLGVNLLILLHYAVAGFFMFLFLRKIHLNFMASFTGGIMFMFCGFFAAHLGHTAMIMAAAYLPVVLYFFETFAQIQKTKFLFLASIAFALCLLADYQASSMYIGMVTFPYIMFRVLTGQEWMDKSFASKMVTIGVCSFVVFIAGSMLAAVQLIPVFESLSNVTRGKISYEFFSLFSFPFQLLPLLIFPYIYGIPYGSALQPSYFGPWNLTEMSGYMGILPVLFSIMVVLLFRRENKQLLFWAAVAIFGFILVLGDSTPLHRLMYYVPIYNMFRAPARNWLEVNFAVAVLASFFIHHMMNADRLKKSGYFLAMYLGSGALMSAALYVLLFGERIVASFDVAAQQSWLKTSRIDSPAVYVPLTIISVSVITLYGLHLYQKSKMYWVFVTVIIFLDLFSFGHFYNQGGDSFKILQKEPNPVADFLAKENKDNLQYRILGLTARKQENQLYPNMNLFYGIQTVNAYSNVWLKEYRELTTFEADGTSAVPLRQQLLLNSTILSSLSTKYIITNREADKDFLHQILVSDSPALARIALRELQEPELPLISSLPGSEEIVTLKSESGGFSMVASSFSLRPRAFYTVTFRARMPEKPGTGEPLIVDFFGENYDSPEQEAHFNNMLYRTYQTKAAVSSEFDAFEVSFYSGNEAPQRALLRFFTYSSAAYQIQNVQLFQIQSFASHLGHLESQATEPSALYVKKFETAGGFAVYENMNFLPRARFATDIVPASSTKQAIDMLWNDNEFDPSHSAIVEAFTGNTSFDGGQVLGADYSDNNRVNLIVRTGTSSFLVLADTWYPGWKAFVDGEETKIYKSNAVLRGIVIEGEGKHIVEFRFQPMSFYIGLGITCITLLLMILDLVIQRRLATDRLSLK